MLPRTFRAFEHQRIRCGDLQRTVDGGRVRFTEAHFEALARFNDRHGGRYFRLGHQALVLREYVGYVQVGDLAIEILPKADRHTAGTQDQLRWRDALLEMLRVATGLKLHSTDQATQAVTRSTLLEIIVTRFMEEVERLLHEGLAKGYREVRENRHAFRGRLLIAENIRRNLVRADRVFVAHQTYDYEITVNRILRTALKALLPLALSTTLRARVARAHADFPEVATYSVRAQDFDRLAFGRNTSRYRSALQYARMILMRESPHLRAGQLPVIALLFDMNALWERYIGRLFLRSRVPGLEAATQSSRVFWRARGLGRRTIRPDIVVRTAATKTNTLIADTKWKVPRDHQPADADLKQMFAYNELYDCQRSLLIYPAAGDDQRAVDGAFSGKEHRCGTVYLGLFHEGRLRTALVQEQVDKLMAETTGILAVPTQPEAPAAFEA